MCLSVHINNVSFTYSKDCGHIMWIYKLPGSLLLIVMLMCINELIVKAGEMRRPETLRCYTSVCFFGRTTFAWGSVPAFSLYASNTPLDLPVRSWSGGNNNPWVFLTYNFGKYDSWLVNPCNTWDIKVKVNVAFTPASFLLSWNGWSVFAGLFHLYLLHRWVCLRIVVVAVFF